MIETVKEKIVKSIQKVSDKNSGIYQETEWAICGRLKTEIEKEFEGYDVDIELKKDDGRRPDIVVHKLGKQTDNLLVIQVKKHPTFKDIEEDINKIKETFFRNPYNYEYGMFISIGEIPKKIPPYDKNKICLIEVYGWKIEQ
jgi:hypothetical protein